jgi:hypothetical protein
MHGVVLGTWHCKTQENFENPMQVPSHFKDRDNDEKAQ